MTTPAAGQTIVFCAAGGMVTAIKTINASSEHMAARKLLEGGRPISLQRLDEVLFRLRALR